jgi:lysyl-tRNA synthetase class 2
MDDTNSLIKQRREKLDALRAKGIDPFKNKFTPTESCDAARKNYAEGREVSVAGRITAHREMGKSMFIDVRDQSGRLQIYAQKNHLEETAPGSWDIFTHLDLGDFIGASGKLFTTKTGEISIKLDSFVILAKALRPPPAKWHGLEDTEIRYRQRYLDLMANPEVKDVFLKRSEIIREIRNFLHARGFVEVETPMMQAIPGGAAAQPFKTHHNALGCDFYLRIALELYLKRLLVGGVDKVFEIGRNFRNEGLSRKHNPEFTMLEAYQAFGDYESMMELVESMVKHVAQKVLGTQIIEHPNLQKLGSAIQSAVDLLKDLSAGNQDRFAISIKDKSDKDAYENAKRESENAIQGLLDCQKRVGSESTFKIASEANDLLRSCVSFFSVARDLWKMGTQDDNETLEFWEVYSKIRNTNKILVALKKPIDLQTPWKRQSYKSLIQEEVRIYTGDVKLDWFSLSDQERREIAVRKLRLGRELAEVKTDFEVTQAIFENYIEPCLIQPTFVTHLPKELVPLAKLSPDDPTTVEVFECCINGQEIAPAYTEQNDPIEQRERLEHQAGGEQQKLDEDFLVALEHGMPPAGGMGMGIDRLCMMLLGQESIRDVILFPQLKPK